PWRLLLSSPPAPARAPAPQAFLPERPLWLLPWERVPVRVLPPWVQASISVKASAPPLASVLPLVPAWLPAWLPAWAPASPLALALPSALPWVPPWAQVWAFPQGWASPSAREVLQAGRSGQARVPV